MREPRKPETTLKQRAEWASLVGWLRKHRKDIPGYNRVGYAKRLMAENGWNLEAAKEAAKESR